MFFLGIWVGVIIGVVLASFMTISGKEAEKVDKYEVWK
jgi:MFS superfamily sulfate permease-like transporter